MTRQTRIQTAVFAILLMLAALPALPSTAGAAQQSPAATSAGALPEGVEVVEHEAGFYYTIKKGDTLWDLGAGSGSVRAIAGNMDIHEEVEAGRPLTGERLTQMYGEIQRRYHGRDEGVLRVIAEIKALSEEQVAEAVEANAARLYRLAAE